MKTRKHRSAVVIGIGWMLVVGMCGCSADYYRAETRVHSDGSVDRAIYQPRKETPRKSRRVDVWKGTTAAERIEPGDWLGPIDELPTAKEDDKHPYFVAWGSFKSADKIPAHYVRYSPDKSRHGRLVARSARKDLVFVTEHRWRETLTDIVTLDDMHIACRELARLAISHVDEVLAKGLGAETDHSRLITWLNGEGTRWFVELADVYFAAGARQQFTTDNEAVTKAFERVCARHGLNRLDEKSIADFAAAKLRKLLRRKDGTPVTDETIESILIWLTLKKVKNEQGKSKTSPLEDVSKEVVNRKHGGQEAFATKLGSLISRIWGVHGPYATSLQKFNYSLVMPGRIVETNGRLESDNRVRWLFGGGEAYPFGYHMTCRSLEPNVAAMKKLLGRQPLRSREFLLIYADIVAGDKPLLAVLKRCVKQNDMAPLKTYRAKLEKEKKKNPEVVEMNVKEPLTAIRRLWKLLGMKQ